MNLIRPEPDFNRDVPAAGTGRSVRIGIFQLARAENPQRIYRFRNSPGSADAPRRSDGTAGAGAVRRRDPAGLSLGSVVPPVARKRHSLGDNDVKTTGFIR